LTFRHTQAKTGDEKDEICQFKMKTMAKASSKLDETEMKNGELTKKAEEKCIAESLLDLINEKFKYSLDIYDFRCFY